MARLMVMIGVRLLEVVFAFGIVGSALVVILTGYEDLREMFEKDKEE